MSQDAKEARAEAWRVWFSLNFFTTLQGIAAPIWWRHLKQNRFRLGPRYLPRVALISVASPINSLFAGKDEKEFGAKIRATVVEPPIFLLGHWRSGTTLLQRFFAMDDRLTYPNFYQCVFPRGFLHSEEKNKQRWSDKLPKTRVFDQMENDFNSPAEDEFALCSLTGYSPYMAWSFPRNWDHYYRYLTMRGVPADERDEWHEALRYFVQKLQFKTGRRVVLKSPTHTCRIRLLRELFPGAKFVHIHRSPYSVFPSTQKMLRIFLQSTQLQSFDPARIDERIFGIYREMYEVYFQERSLIPPEDFCEVGYEELEQSPIEEMERIYGHLGLPDFEHLRPTLAEHVASLKGYQKNKFRELPAEIRERIDREWALTLDEWSYAPTAGPGR